MLMTILLYIITIIHILFILFVVIVPFTSINYLLLLHLWIVPFVVFHWLINDDTCCLTIVERHLRYTIYGKKPSDDDCITYKLIGPIYNFTNNHRTQSILIYVITIALWLLTVYKLYRKYSDGEITKWSDLLMFQ